MFLPEASAADSGIIRIQQGQKVSVGNIIDISGVVPPYPQLAYWDGYNEYDSAPTYILTLSNYRSAWYSFNVDPAIFATRLGSWYKYDQNIGYESKGNNLAFVVVRENVAPVTTIPTTNDISETFTPLPTSSMSTPMPTHILTPTPTPTPTQWNFEKSDYALWSSILIVGLCFGFFELYRFRSSGKK
ncbi:MAG: DUF3821 domain-containing protein [Methanoregula sp.]